MMNFLQQEKGYCNNEEDEDEETTRLIRQTSKHLFSSSSSSSFASSTHKTFGPSHQNLWLGSFDSQEEYKSQEATINFDKTLELMDFSLGNNHNNNEEPSTGTGTGTAGGESSSRSIEKEHMFDKVVTPSDVGKLNRLVIPKQHAEKYFPLDSSSNEKGLLLNFEDRNGKAWRFRYSYWNSSQSYVMTKGWSRFVKEKKLDAGDIVSFQRGVGELGKDRLYIDWRRRPDAPDLTSIAQTHLQNQLNFQQSIRWGRLYSLPQSLSIPRNYEQWQRPNYSNIYPSYYDHQHQQQHQMISYENASHYNYPIRSSSSTHQIGAVQEGGNGLLLLDSVPVVHANTAAKRLRLFGVNMECSTQEESSPAIVHAPISSVSYLPPLQQRLPNNASFSTTQSKGKSSLSFDLDL
ncbi:B3 domain-containing transcription factor NGA1-like [Mangifera indica]|uniref:B3 domain-containing transcription factor NGA1-like n=1 Tax=Mangifera indica TaxID=29780 RepID=UPI001CFB0D4E|nr:B3 domain-containing transcription factor NGA1-like [Mangifera indica]